MSTSDNPTSRVGWGLGECITTNNTHLDDSPCSWAGLDPRELSCVLGMSTSDNPTSRVGWGLGECITTNNTHLDDSPCSWAGLDPRELSCVLGMSSSGPKPGLGRGLGGLYYHKQYPPRWLSLPLSGFGPQGTLLCAGYVLIILFLIRWPCVRGLWGPYHQCRCIRLRRWFDTNVFWVFPHGTHFLQQLNKCTKYFFLLSIYIIAYP